ncbi:MAG: hypothetical protein R3E08_11940 [Thiotrichaceae bacterium]
MKLCSGSAVVECADAKIFEEFKKKAFDNLALDIADNLTCCTH